MQKKTWLLLALAAFSLNAGAVFAGDDDDKDQKSQEVSSSDETTKEEPTASDCGCKG